MYLAGLYAQFDRHAVQDLETVEGLLAFTASGDVRVAEDYHAHPESRLVQERYLGYWSSGAGAVSK